VPDKLAGFIEHTLLKPGSTEQDVRRFCREAIDHSFYAVCINPSWAKTALSELKGSAVKICVVVGFPLGTATTAVKAYEAADAVESGAAEIDMVMHSGALKSGNDQYVVEDIAAVVKAVNEKPVKVIIETGLLSEEEKVLACRLAEKGGAHFVKNSTGFGPGQATPADIKLMRETVGKRLGVKASAGIRTRAAAEELIRAGANRIGTSAGVEIIME